MKKRIVFALLLVLVLSFSSVLTVFADEAEKLTAVTVASGEPITGTLQGNHAGAFFYASIPYPGDESVITIDLHVVPGDPVTILGAGFHLYNADGTFSGTAQLVDVGHLQLQYSSSVKEDLLLQIFNYVDGANIDFSFTVSGLSSVNIPQEVQVENENVATPKLTPTPKPSEATNPIDTMTGTLGPASMDHYAVFYGKDVAVTVVMTYNPADDIIAQGVDLNVYGPNGEVDYTSTTANVNGVLTLTFNATAGTRYEFVAANWLPNVTVSYHINSSPMPDQVSLSN